MSESRSLKPIKLIHITTVPQSLHCFFHGQMGFMKKQGFNVVAISSPGAHLDSFAEREDIQVVGLEISRKITPLKDLRTLWNLWRLLRRLNPDIVHAHTPKGGLLGIIAAWMARIPIRIYHIHGLRYLTAEGLQRPILILTEKISCKLANRVLCVSNSIRELVVQSKICPSGKIKTLLNGTINGIDAQNKFNPEKYPLDERDKIRKKYGIAPNSLVLGFVGRIVKDKGIAELYDAWKSLREEFPSLELLLAGPVETNDPLPVSLLDGLKSDSRIHMTGGLSDVAPIYAVTDIFVFPTYREGFGVVAIEASAMGIPVVATDIPGVVDAVVDGQTGVLIPPFDAIAIKNAVRNYLLDPSLRAMHGRAGRARVLDVFKQERMWSALNDEYHSLLYEFAPDRVTNTV